MQATSLFLLFTRRLGQLGARYMITGGAAAIVYGEPRLTNDVDLVAVLDSAQAARLGQVFPFLEFYHPGEAAIQVELARGQRGHFNIIHLESGFKADIYLAGRDPLNAWGLGLARTLEIGGEPVSVAPPEYVIVRKLEYFREGGSSKHLRDIQSMLALSAEVLDRALLEEKITERGLQVPWGEALQYGELI